MGATTGMRLNRAAIAQAMPKIETGYIKPFGGLDENTPTYERKPGVVRSAQNFEADLNGGYSMVEGYERFDGRTAPSSASYTMISATITGTVAVGDTLTGNTSAATGKVIAITSTQFVLTKVVGTFVDTETLNVGGTPVATATSGPTTNSASTPMLDAVYLNLAADVYRADIAAPTGSGKILGGFYYNGKNYCFRNNAGGTAADMFIESTSGWTQVALGRELDFTSGGTTEIVEGSTITGATSGATAVLTRVVLRSGAWAAGTAVGKFIFASQTGTFQAENINVGASLNLATIAGNSSAITLAPSGRFEIEKHNFGGTVNSYRVYGCDGVSRGFEFDGTVFVPIATGMTADTPSFVRIHKNQLFFAFGASVQHSAPGTPYIWDPILGASEIAAGDTVTGLSSQPGATTSGALAIFTRNRLHILYGTGVDDWNNVSYRDELGAWAYTVQEIGRTFFLDDRDITDINTSQSYGNFEHNGIARQIKTTFNAWKPYVISSAICRKKSQYRLFFTNSQALYITISGGKVIGIMPILFPDVMRCAWTSEDSNGNEVMYCGGNDGVVYQMDKGTSFDGDPIEFFLDFSYNFFGAPRVDKSYHDATIEVTGNGYASFDFGYSLGYGSTRIPQPIPEVVPSNFSSVNWDSFTWDSFTWDGSTLAPNTVDMRGQAENVSIGIRGNSDYYTSFTITGIIVHYANRRLLRV